MHQLMVHFSHAFATCMLELQSAHSWHAWELNGTVQSPTLFTWFTYLKSRWIIGILFIDCVRHIGK